MHKWLAMHSAPSLSKMVVYYVWQAILLNGFFFVADYYSPPLLCLHVLKLVAY